MQDLEFTIERGKLWMLQTRSGKRTAKAAIRIAVEMAREGPDLARGGDLPHRSGLARPAAAPDHRSRAPSATSSARGLPASPGAATGEIVFSSEDAEDMKAKGRKVVLVRIETSPEDIHGMHAAEGILTTRGGMTSHAAVVARGMGKPCVSGAGSLRVDYRNGTLMAMGVTLRKGDVITIDGGTGQVLKGAVPMLQPELSGDFATRDGLGRRDPPHEGAHQCRDAGRCAHGALVRRRGHRALPHRAHVLRRRPHRRHARDDPGRHRAGPPRRARQAAADAALGFPASCSRSWPGCR